MNSTKMVLFIDVPVPKKKIPFSFLVYFSGIVLNRIISKLNQ